jgi:hypothetical protein
MNMFWIIFGSSIILPVIFYFAWFEFLGGMLSVRELGQNETDPVY